METATNPTKCETCQTGERMFSDDPEVVASVTQMERTRWSLWGCFCTQEQADEANAWMESVTR